ncbi:hypothetical protein CPC08DRAFT_760349 [Agrocybe pediades]|nr:hypothetical protein CPC08DRAFT_760349 [Agrocybe pediades]
MSSSPFGQAGYYPLDVARENDWEWFKSVFTNMWSLILLVVETVLGWLESLGPSVAWTFHAFSKVITFVETHPHPFHIIGWSIFFGPIIVLLPCLVLLELGVLLGMYASYLGHGLIPGSVEATFPTLLSKTYEPRESLFANIDLCTAAVNKWTSTYPALLVFRVLAGVMSACLFVGLVRGWW